MYTAEVIESNWNIFLSNINKYISPERATVLNSFYERYDNRFALMPASGKTSYHNAFPGGYIDHVNRVTRCAFKLKQLWEETGANINFSDEELAMVAINHDLGKFGTEEAEYYIEQDSDWHVKNKGELYKHNALVSFMKVQDRSLYILQTIGISLSENEYLGIKLHDGLYEESNKSYYMSFSPEFELRSNLPYIVQQADLMAAKIEKDIHTRNNTKAPIHSVTTAKATATSSVITTSSPSLKAETKKIPTGNRILDKFLNE